MIFSQVAGLADAARVQLAVFMLTAFGHFDPSFGVVAVFAHATRIVVFVNMLTLRDHLPVLHWLALPNACFLPPRLLLVALFLLFDAMWLLHARQRLLLFFGLLLSAFPLSHAS